MKVVRREDELINAIAAAKSQAKAGFGDDAVYLEKYLESRRTSRFRCLAMARVRDSSRRARLLAQRRHQKVWEEARSPALNAEQARTLAARLRGRWPNSATSASAR